jgi:hypothetical protein
MVTGKDVQDCIMPDDEKDKENIWDLCRRSGSILLTGGAIVNDGKATLVVGSGTDNLLEATYEFPNIDGIIGDGRSIIFDTKQNTLYSVHSDDEVRFYFAEDYSKRQHKPIMSSAASKDVIILNLNPSTNGKYPFEFSDVKGESIDVRSPSKNRKSMRNFASKASHVRQDDIYLMNKETIPMEFEEIYKGVMPLGMNYHRVNSPFFNGCALSYVLLGPRHNLANSHVPILKKVIEAKIL